MYLDAEIEKKGEEGCVYESIYVRMYVCIPASC